MPKKDCSVCLGPFNLGNNLSSYSVFIHFTAIACICGRKRTKGAQFVWKRFLNKNLIQW